jgi:NitT/TauT family transport system substrate-binding protein
MVVNTETLEANPDFGKALVGAWYEVMGLMAAGRRGGADRDGRGLGHRSGRLQGAARLDRDVLRPRRSGGLHRKPELPKTMVSVAEFLFDKGILGEGAPSPDFVGVAYPDGVGDTGDPNNVKFRFDTTYMQMAADGAL